MIDSLRYFIAPGEPVELRFLGVDEPRRTHAGWITLDDTPSVANKVTHLADRTNGVYFTPQILSSSVLSRSPRGFFGNVRKDGKQTKPQLTSDADITHRRYLIIDVDPTKPELHKHDSATDQEKDAARIVADKVRDYLRSAGWSDPLVVDSGNGYHCYYRLPMLFTGGDVDSATDPIAKLLRHLARLHSTTTATIDTKVFNASRIMKLPGTWARKGSHSTHRPHRVSRIIEVPNDWTPPTDRPC